MSTKFDPQHARNILVTDIAVKLWQCVNVACDACCLLISLHSACSTISCCDDMVVLMWGSFTRSIGVGNGRYTCLVRGGENKLGVGLCLPFLLADRAGALQISWWYSHEVQNSHISKSLRTTWRYTLIHQMAILYCTLPVISTMFSFSVSWKERFLNLCTSIKYALNETLTILTKRNHLFNYPVVGTPLVVSNRPIEAQLHWSCGH